MSSDIERLKRHLGLGKPFRLPLAIAGLATPETDKAARERRELEDLIRRIVREEMDARIPPAEGRAEL